MRSKRLSAQVEVAPLPVAAGQSLACESQALPFGDAGRDFDGDGARASHDAAAAASGAERTHAPCALTLVAGHLHTQQAEPLAPASTAGRAGLLMVAQLPQPATARADLLQIELQGARCAMNRVLQVNLQSLLDIAGWGVESRGSEAPAPA